MRKHKYLYSSYSLQWNPLLWTPLVDSGTPLLWTPLVSTMRKHKYLYSSYSLQWNPFTVDTIGLHNEETQVLILIILATVEPLYYGHHWDSLNCPDFRGVLISDVHYIIIVLYAIVAFGTMKSVLI